MTLIIASALNQVLKETDLHNPAATAAEVNRTVKQSLGQFDGGRQAWTTFYGEMHSGRQHGHGILLGGSPPRIADLFAGAKTPLFIPCRRGGRPGG